MILSGGGIERNPIWPRGDFIVAANRFALKANRIQKRHKSRHAERKNNNGDTVKKW